MLLPLFISILVYYVKYGRNQDNLEQDSIRRKKMLSKIKGEEYIENNYKKDEIPLKTKILRFIVIFVIVYFITLFLQLIGRTV